MTTPRFLLLSLVVGGLLAVVLTRFQVIAAGSDSAFVRCLVLDRWTGHVHAYAVVPNTVVDRTP